MNNQNAFDSSNTTPSPAIPNQPGNQSIFDPGTASQPPVPNQPGNTGKSKDDKRAAVAAVIAFVALPIIFAILIVIKVLNDLK